MAVVYDKLLDRELLHDHGSSGGGGGGFTFKYNFDADTSDTSPSSGYIKFNSTKTKVSFNMVTSNGIDVTTIFNDIQLAGTRHDIAFFKIEKALDPTVFVYGRVRFPNDYSFQVINENGSFSADDAVILTVHPLKRIQDKILDSAIILGSTIDSTPPDVSTSSGSTYATRHQTRLSGTFTIRRVRVYTYTSSSLTIKIYSDSGDIPDTILGTVDVSTNPTNLNQGIEEFDFPETSITSDTFYWVVVSGSSGYFLYHDDVPMIISDGFAEPINVVTSGLLGMNAVSFLEHPSMPAIFAYGGTDGQVLTKQSSTDYDFAWEDPSGGSGLTQSQLMARLSIGF